MNKSLGKFTDPTRHIDKDMDSDPDDDDLKLKVTSSGTEAKDEKFALNRNTDRYIKSSKPSELLDSKVNYFEDRSTPNLADMLQKQRQNYQNPRSDKNSDRSRSRSPSVDDRRTHEKVATGKVAKILLHPAMIGLYAAIFIFILLVSIQPGFIMKSVPLTARAEEMAEPTQQHMLRQRKKINWITVTVVSLVTGILVGLTPYLVEVIVKSIKKKKAQQSEQRESNHSNDGRDHADRDDYQQNGNHDDRDDNQD